MNSWARGKIERLLAFLELKHDAGKATPSKPVQLAIPAVTTRQKPSSLRSSVTPTSAVPPSSPDSRPQVAEGGSNSMGGKLSHTAASTPLANPPNALNKLCDPLDSPPPEGVAVSGPLAALSTSVQKLTDIVNSLHTRMDTWETGNRFASLQQDATDPLPPPIPAARSYAAAASLASPAAHTASSAAPRAAAPTKPAPRTSLIAGTADLPATHFVRALSEHRILPCVRKMIVSSSLDPTTLVYARRMERGDVQLVTRGPSAANLLRRAVAAHSAEIVTKMPVEATLLVLHWVPADADAGEVEEKMEEWIGGEGRVAATRWLSRRADTVGQGPRTAQTQYLHVHPSAECHRSPPLTRPHQPGSASNAASLERAVHDDDFGPSSCTSEAISHLQRARKALLEGTIGPEMNSRARGDIERVLTFLKLKRDAGKATPSKPFQPAVPAAATRQTPSSLRSSATPTSPVPPSLPDSHPQVVEGGSNSMGGKLSHTAASTPLDNPPNALDKPCDPLDSPPSEGVAVSGPLAALSTSVQKLTDVVNSLHTRMDTWELSNHFAILQRDATDPPPPSAPAVRSYAAAAAAACPDAPPEPPAAPRASAPSKPAPRTSLIAGTADLPATHFLRALPEHRILPCVHKMMVSSSLDPSTLVYARRMERGDVQLVTRGPSAADLLRRALSAYSAEITVKMPVEATSLVMHWVPVDADEVEVREKVEEWVGGEG
ncbi:RHTO0S02e00958g1_1 [Rhodotorula toruloides]|uniref:RHTO0S02e00958g1_1 n=1 Tax=Rhodotorula toruloides TaxID=5286 RepID=A0A061AM01_RHOTO|nr:RHTO0S02e00958g1_1 [Rhodotorula toruloides]